MIIHRVCLSSRPRWHAFSVLFLSPFALTFPIHLALRRQRAQNEVFGLCSEEDMDLEWLEKAIIAELEKEGVDKKFK